MKLISAATLVLALTVHGAPDRDFKSLVHHWNFDEGRDWHNMPFPFHSEAQQADDSVGSVALNLPGRNKDRAWAAGRQYSGVRMSAGSLEATDNLKVLAGTCSISFWLRMKKTEGYIIGDRKGIVYGVVLKNGHVGVIARGKVVLQSRKPLTDDKWHHLVFTRNADSGRICLYVDGKPDAAEEGPTGKLGEHFTHIGVSPKGKQFSAVLDQLHVFKRVIKGDTVHALYDNHAPRIYDQSHLVDKKEATRTGSILHLYTHDNELDSLRVFSHGQGKFGSVENNGDGTFTYTPGEAFPGKDQFSVVVTDDKGGFCRANMKVYDYRYADAPVTCKFTFYGDLPDLPESYNGSSYRRPMAIRLKNRQSVDLLVYGNSRLWYYENKSTKGKLEFAAPVEVTDTSGEPLHVEGAAVLESDELLIRMPHSTMKRARLVVSGSAVQLEPGEVILDTEGAPLKVDDRFFSCMDFDLDGQKDLICGFSWGMYMHRNSGQGKKLCFDAGKTKVHDEAYNVFPGIGDIDRNGRTDLLHGNNWGHLFVWQSASEGKSIIDGKRRIALKLLNAPKPDYLPWLNGTNLVAEDFDGDGVVDLVIGSNQNSQLAGALGVSPELAAKNLKIIEKEIYKGHQNDLGKVLMADNEKLLKRYKELMHEWTAWAVAQNTPASRASVYSMLKKHVRRFPFLQRRYLQEAWVKKDENTKKVTSFGNMHHVPGIFTQNWIVLHQLMPDSAAHRKDVADALGMTGPDREQYLTTGLPLADNNHCSEGQLKAISDMMLRHPRILFPDDHLSIDLHFGDGRDAMCYIFRSNKNTFGSETGSYVNEMERDMVLATEACLGGKGAANGDYFTLVMAHEVCHSLDAYVYKLPNQDLWRRWGDMLVYAGNNGGKSGLIVAGKNGWFDSELTQKKFRAEGRWNGREDWNKCWEKYWDSNPFKDKTFMRGNIGWFLYTRQESLATQANHHWPRSESRLIGAILRYKMGYKAPLNEALHYLDILSAGMNKIHMYHTRTSQETRMVDFHSDPAWLVRNDKGYITDICIGERVYSFKIDVKGRAVGIRSHPFEDILNRLARELK